MRRHAVTVHAPEALRHALLHVTEIDLIELHGWVPAGSQELVRVLGTRLAVRLINAWPGAKLRIPQAESTSAAGERRRAMLQAVLGTDDTRALCTAWAGEVIQVPVFRSLLGEKRRRWLRAAYDELMGESATEPRSKAEAIYELGLRLAAAGLVMTARQIEGVLDQPGPMATDERQADLFT